MPSITLLFLLLKLTVSQISTYRKLRILDFGNFEWWWLLEHLSMHGNIRQVHFRPFYQNTAVLCKPQNQPWWESNIFWRLPTGQKLETTIVLNFLDPAMWRNIFCIFWCFPFLTYWPWKALENQSLCNKKWCLRCSIIGHLKLPTKPNKIVMNFEDFQRERKKKT